MDMTKEEVSRVHREDFYGALKKNDLEKLSQIYSADYMLVRPDGSAFSKTQILDDLKGHSMSFSSKELTNEKIRIYGSVGILKLLVSSWRSTANPTATDGSLPWNAKERYQLISEI
jgi:hypothetical protein